ncbi:MAG: phage tail tape measure protein [Thermodesulfobacteriota bacterium]
MADNLKLGIRIGVDAKDAESNVTRFEREFQRVLEGLGKTAPEIAAFRELELASAAGQKSLEGVDAQTLRLIGTFREMREVARAQDMLQIVPHQEIRGRIDQVNQAFATLKASGTLTQKELAQAALKANQQITQLQGSTNGWSDALLQAKTSLAGVVGAGAGLGYVVKQAMDFESAMADVRKVVDASPEQFAALTREIQDLTKELPLSAKELAAIAAAGGQLGVTAEDLGEFTRLAAQMATAFNMSAEQAGQAIAKLANVYGLPIAKVRELGDAINTLGNNTAATEAGIIETMTRIGGTAEQFGLATEQAAALSAAFISLGKAPEVAARSINALLAKLQTARVGTDQFKGGLEALGLSADALADRIAADPQKALSEFLHTLEALDKQSRAEILTQLFGEGYQDDIAVVVGALGQYDKALGLVADKTKTAGAMQNEFATRMETTAAQLDLLKNAVDRIATNLGTVLLPAVKGVVDGATAGADALASFAETFPVISQLAGLLVTLATTAGGLKVAFLAAKVAGLDMAEGVGERLKAMNQPIRDAARELGGLRTAMSVVSAFAVGWEIGTWLSSKFEVVRKAGVLMAWAVTKAFEDVRYAWELTKATLSDDTWEEATRRHTERTAEIKAGYEDLWEQAGKGAAETAKATQKAGDAAKDAGKKVGDAGKQGKAGLKEAKEEAKELQQALGALSADAFKALTGVSRQARDAAGSFADTVQTVGALGKEGERVAKIFAGEWAAALKKATDPADVEHLTDTLRMLWENGDLGARQYAQGLELAKQRMEELTGATVAGGNALTAYWASVSEAAKKAHAAQVEHAKKINAAAALGAEKTREAGGAWEDLQKKGTAAWEALQGGARAAGQAGEQAAGQAAKGLGVISAEAAAARASVAALGEEAEAAYLAVLRMGGRQVVSLAELKSAAAGITYEYARQAAAVDALTARLSGAEGATRANVAAAEDALESYQLLGDERLGGLRDALSDARRRALELRDAAADTVATLQDELDQLNRNTAAIEKRRYAAQVADLEDKRRQAQAAKDAQAVADLNQALRLAKQIHDQKMGAIAAEAAAEKQRAADETKARRESREEELRQREGLAAPRASELAREDASRTRTGEFAPARTVRVEFGAGGPAGEFAEADLDRMLRMFEELGARTV